MADYDNGSEGCPATPLTDKNLLPAKLLEERLQFELPRRR